MHNTKNEALELTALETESDLVQKWLVRENLASKEKREFGGFEIISSIDGGENPEKEVSLVKITAQGQYPQHIHKASDATFIIVSGRAILLSGQERKELKAGDRVEIPRGVPHGFELAEGEVLEFISIQSPPIRNRETGEEDFHLIHHI